MIIERTEQIPPLLPTYLSTNVEGDSILGIGRESAAIIKDAVEIVGVYRRAIESGSVSIVEQRDTYVVRNIRAAAYGFILDQLELLKTQPEADDLGRIRPSQHAISAATVIVFRMLETRLGVPVPADISTDNDGAIRILWENGDRTLEVVCPFEISDRPYVYFADNDQHRIAHDLSLQRFTRLLFWLAGRDNTFPR